MTFSLSVTHTASDELLAVGVALAVSLAGVAVSILVAAFRRGE